MTDLVGAPRTVSRQLADLVMALDYQDIPDDVLASAKLLVLDQLGLQIRGSRLPHVQPERRLVEGMGARPEATVVGSAVRTTPSLAAFANGTFGHSMEFDDCHLQCWHAGSVIVAAGLALSERHSRSGREFLTAIVAGHQLMSTVGAVCTANMMGQGWHAPKVVGGFAAAAVAARLENVSPATLAHAFGIAGSDASGTMEYDRAGGEVKRLHAGSGARSGMDAVTMAGFGLTGPPGIFEGPRGIFAIFGATTDFGDLAQVWATWHLRDTMFRLNPGVGTVLPVLDIVADLQREHSFDWREVTSVRVGLRPFAVDHGGHIVHPTDGISAHFSLAFAVALRLVSGRSAPEDYVEKMMWVDPTIWKVSELVQVSPYEFDESMPLLSAHVDIYLTDGRTLSATQGGFHGSPDLPATYDDLVEKFRRNVAGILAPEPLLTVLADLESVDDMTRVAALLAVP